MEIVLAKSAGFCFGVDRAVNLVYDMINKGVKVHTLGPIIHNPQLIDDLKSKGVTILEKPEDVAENETVVIRTHGVPRSVYEKMKTEHLNYIDATCPFVQKIHKIVSDVDENTIVFIAGNKNHPEVEGIFGHCKGEYYVFKNLEELKSICENDENIAKKDKIFVSQTTFSLKEWNLCANYVKKVYTNAKIFDTICSATAQRQQDAVNLSKTADLMIIIGGRTSSNTRKLFEVSKENCKSYLIETADELSNISFSGCKRVGVTAGASTPDGIIKEVLETMSEIIKEENIAENDAVVEATEKINDEEMSFEQLLNESFKDDRGNNDGFVVGTVTAVYPTEIQVDIGGKHTGYVKLEELTNDPDAKPEDIVSIGDKLNLIIMKTNDAEGMDQLSKVRFDARKGWIEIADCVESKEIIEGLVTDVIRGGVLAACKGVKVFIPASLSGLRKGEDLNSLKGQTVRFRIIEANPAKRKAVASIRSVLREEKKAAREAFWAEVAEGNVYTGTVKSLTPYGAFVDLGGVDGMIHISELSWNRIKHPGEVVNVGDTVEVYVKSIDAENKKISLGYKKTEDNPWEILKNTVPVGSTKTVKIVGLTSFGAFANVIDGIDGLIHISQIDNKRVENPADVLKVGDEVEVKVTEIDYDKKRVSLSIKALLPEPEKPEEKEVSDEPMIISTDDPESIKLAAAAVEAEEAQAEEE